MSNTRVAISLIIEDGATGALRKIREGLSSMGREGESAIAQLNKASANFATGLDRLSKGRELKSRLVDPLVSAAGDVESAQRRLMAQLPQADKATTEEMLRRADVGARKTSGPLPQSQAEVLDIQTEFLKSGATLEQAIAGADAAGRLSLGQNTDIGTAQAALEVFASQFNLSADQIGVAADLMSRAADVGKGDPRYFQEAMASFSQARAVGADPRETLALFTATAGKMSASEAGNAADALVTKAATLKDKALRGQLYDESGKFRGFGSLMDALKERTSGMSQQESTAYMTRVFGDGPAAKLATLLASGSVELDKALAGMESSRSLDEKIAIAADSLPSKMEALGGSLTSLRAQLGRPLLAPLKKAADEVNNLVSKASEAVEADPRIAQGASYGAAGIAAGFAITGVMNMILGAGQGAGGLFGALRAGVLGKVGQAGALTKGIAMGKAVEEAGVQPVYVVNAAEFPGGTGAPALPIPAATATGGRAAAGAMAMAGPVGWGAAAGTMVGLPLAKALNENEWFGAARDAWVANSPVVAAAGGAFQAAGNLGGQTGEIAGLIGAAINEWRETKTRQFKIVVTGEGVKAEVFDEHNMRREMARHGAL